VSRSHPDSPTHTLSDSPAGSGVAFPWRAGCPTPNCALDLEDPSIQLVKAVIGAYPSYMTVRRIGDVIQSKRAAVGLAVSRTHSDTTKRPPTRRANARDAFLGAALVTSLPLVVLCTFWLLPAHDGAAIGTLAIELCASLLALCLLLLPWSRLPASSLLVFPAVLATGLLTAASVERAVTASYIGFLTVAFIYIGITQSRLGPVLAMPIAIPLYLLCEIHVTPEIAVRLPIAVVIWLVIGEVLADHSARNRSQTDALAEQVQMDGLTGLMSRAGLCGEIDLALREVEGLDGDCFLFLLDIDGFKSANDTFGHLVGDELLVEFAQRVRGAIRSNDMGARIGGDEFAVLIKGANLAIATSLGERLLIAAAEPFDLSFGRVHVTASEGIVQLTPSMETPDVMRDADIALYEAKSKGISRLAFFEPRLQQKVADRVRLGIELHSAVENEEFELHWQPTVHIGTGRTVGVEALIRWRHPARGMLLPAEFINTAEDIGLIVPIGKWVVGRACHQGKDWQPADLGRLLTISVNVSPHQLLDGTLCRDVKDALASSGLPGTALILEITERTLMVSSPLIREQLDELKQLGIRLAIDDFGTGYSSLAYLRSFPIDIVKIDQSFVAALDEDEQAVALVRSIISIAEALGLDTVAEGVETVSQLETLRRLGCQVAQGHYFSRARPAESFVSYLQADEMVPSAELGS
jgi:diguanylate cyclase (GGDEF)-like protein